MDRRLGTKLPDWANSDSVGGMKFDKFIYAGIVKQNVDPLRLGRLRVWFPDSGADEDNENGWRWVTYASPFYGSTKQSEKSKSSKFDAVESTYGMWMVPPDVGNEVLCVFVNGDPGRGYWFACTTTTKLSHAAVPAIGRITDNIDKASVNSEKVKAALARTESVFLPNGEFNENLEENVTGGFLTNRFAVHEPQAEILIDQGLDTDRIRGAISSSSMRDAPSAVFGISTPGRTDQDSVTPKTRNGGHTFVMDDGDNAGADQLIRLRTAGGHQILMNDSDDVLYIANNNGTAWIEFGNSGALHMYSMDGFNVRTQGSMNLHADKAFNIQGDTVNIRAITDLKLQGATLTAKALNDMTLFASTTKIGSSGSLSLTAGGELGVKAGSELKLVGSKIKLNDGAVTAVEDPGELAQYGQADADRSTTTQLWSSVDGSLNTICTVAPSHEPWPRNSQAVSATNVSNTAVAHVCSDEAPSVPTANGPVGGAGPFGDFIGKLESGSIGYNAFNRGSSPPKGTGSVGGEKMDLVNMTIADIQALQFLPRTTENATKRLFAVGRYQCIPDTLKAACSKLGIPFSSKFTAEVQDTIFINSLCGVGSLKAYLKGNNKDDDALLIQACSTTAGIWASVEDPTLSPVRGRYDGVGTNHAKGKVAECKASLKAQWDFLHQGAANKSAASNTVTSGSGGAVTDGSGNPVFSNGTNEDLGIKAAAGKPVDKKAPNENMKQSDAPSVNDGLEGSGNPGTANYIPSLIPKQVQALMVQIAFSESANKLDYKTITRVGRYAVNAILLSEYGYIKSDYYKKYHLDSINDKNAWTGKGGVKTLDDFLKNRAAQDEVMLGFIQDSYKRLKTSSPRGVDMGDSICVAAGMIYVSYFFRDETQAIGSDVNAMVLAAADWRKTNKGQDKDKNTPHNNYNLGRYAIDMLSVDAGDGTAPSGGEATPPSDTGIDPAAIFNFTATATKADFDKLTTTFKNAILAAGKAYKEISGKKITLASTYRSQEDQDRLYKRWTDAGGKLPDKPSAGGVTTPAKTVGSHQGVAIDAGSQAEDIARTIDLARFGLRWGGTFKTPDRVHIQLASYVPGAKIQ